MPATCFSATASLRPSICRWDFATTTNVPGDTFIGGDATLDSSDVVVGATNLLLVYLPVTTLTALPPDVSDTFTISLVPVSRATARRAIRSFRIAPVKTMTSLVLRAR